MRKLERAPKSINIRITSEQLQQDALQYERLKRKRKNAINRLDHFFRIATHPFLLAIYLVVLVVVYFIVRYIGRVKGGSALLLAEKDLKMIISYVATAAFSSMFQEMLDYIHRKD